jgi:hypothetical protein
VSRLPALVGLALHELWISFRLLLLLTLPLLGGLAVGMVPAELSGVRALEGSAWWFGVSLCASVALCAALAAGSVAIERQRGTIAWMAVRAVPRSAVLLSWFLAIGLVLLGGIALGAFSAWLVAIGRLPEPPDPAPFMAAVGAAGASALLVVAVALLVSVLPLSAAWAALLGLLVAAGMLVASLIGPLGATPSPTAGLGLLADLGASARPVGDGIRSTGSALAAAAVVLVLAAAILERRDL